MQCTRPIAQLLGVNTTTEFRADAESPKRHAMLEAGAALFMAQGYGAVSMDAVARAAGVSKATLYAHFSSKEQLFATIIGDACRQKIALGEELLPAHATDVRAALTSFGGRLLRFFLEERPLALHRVVIGESPRFPELGRAFYDNGPKALIGMFAAWLIEQTDAGRLAVHDPAMAGEQFVAMLRTSLFLRASLGLAQATEAEIDATVAAAVTTFLKANAPG
ncbi:MAG TPA: TetR/AcrR family transcriptional regulator [Acetobacteraceae bacterium]|nr:TetR/AcrR family transcriptional regulator [Acetobacteraceae bacterium]